MGPEGGRIVALVADRLLQAHDLAVQKRVAAILATDKDNSWTKTDFAGEATWADALMDKSQEGRAATAQWHYVELDAASPDLAKACFGQPELPATTPAIHGRNRIASSTRSTSSPENCTIPARQPASG